MTTSFSTVRRRLACMTATALLAFAPTLAFADDAMGDAKKRFEEGLELADKGDHDAARLKFLQASAVYRSGAVLFNLARAEQLTNHEVEALEHFRQFLKLDDPKITPAQRQMAEKNVRELSKKMAHVVIEAPAGAHLTVDGKAHDGVPREALDLAPGRHSLSVEWNGDVKTQPVDCVADTTTTTRFTFDPKIAPGTGPREEAPWSTARIVTVGALGAGAVAGGILFFVFRGGAQSDVDEARVLLNGGSCVGVTSADCTRAASLKDSRDSSQTLANVSLAAGGVLAAGAIATALFWPKGSGKETARVLPIVAPGSVGAGVTGRF